MKISTGMDREYVIINTGAGSDESDLGRAGRVRIRIFLIKTFSDIAYTPSNTHTVSCKFFAVCY